MKKNQYIQPVTDVIVANMEQPLLESSVKEVTTTGLDDENLQWQEATGNAWDIAL
jgi:hypothetical protein